MKLLIQNMVSLRCTLLVRSELEKLGILNKSIELGEEQLAEPIAGAVRDELKAELHKSGL